MNPMCVGLIVIIIFCLKFKFVDNRYFVEKTYVLPLYTALFKYIFIYIYMYIYIYIYMYITFLF